MFCVISVENPATDGASFTAIHQFIDGLTCRGEDGEITKALAEDYSTSEDGLTWTFKIPFSTLVEE